MHHSLYNLSCHTENTAHTVAEGNVMKAMGLKVQCVRFIGKNMAENERNIDQYVFISVS